MTATCKTMLPAIGAWIQVRFESVWVECEVIDVKSSWGKDRLWVKPIAGEGLQWVELTRVRYVEPVQEKFDPQSDSFSAKRTLHRA